jgi:tRNA A-37 threonylcarbamoyl transferase component Bud32
MISSMPADASVSEEFREGRYVTTRRLGEGGQAETFEAVDKLRGCPVAIKRFRVKGARSWKEVDLAEREARVLATLDHPNIPRHVDHFEENGCLFLVTERVEGETLAELRQRGVAFGASDIARLLDDARTTLGYLHKQAPPVIHRDIKPGNVIRRPDGSFAFVDFGAVRDSLKPEGGSTVVGTFGYMAPEQIQGRALPATDVYSLGATALALLTGREPESLPHRGLGLDVSRALGNSADPEIVRVLSAMLEPDPDRRAAAVPQVVLGAAPPQRNPPQGRPHHGGPRPWQPPMHDKRHGQQWPGWQSPHHRPGWPPMGTGPMHPYWVRRQRRAMRRRRPIPVPIIVTLLLIGVLVARIALFATLQVAVPVVLTLLSVLFGPGLERAGRRVSDAGRSAARSLDEARLWLLGDASAGPPTTQGHSAPPVRQVRVETEGTRRAPTQHQVRVETPVGSNIEASDERPEARGRHKTDR